MIHMPARAARPCFVTATLAATLVCIAAPEAAAQPPSRNEVFVDASAFRLGVGYGRRLLAATSVGLAVDAGLDAVTVGWSPNEHFAVSRGISLPGNDESELTEVFGAQLWLRQMIAPRLGGEVALRYANGYHSIRGEGVDTRHASARLGLFATWRWISAGTNVLVSHVSESHSHSGLVVVWSPLHLRLAYRW